MFESTKPFVIGYDGVKGLDVHGEQKPGIRGECERVENLKRMVGIFDESGKILNNGTHERVQIARNEFSGTTAGRNNRASRIVRFVDFRKEINFGGPRSGDDEVFGGRREVT